MTRKLWWGTIENYGEKHAAVWMGEPYPKDVSEIALFDFTEWAPYPPQNWKLKRWSKGYRKMMLRIQDDTLGFPDDADRGSEWYLCDPGIDAFRKIMTPAERKRHDNGQVIRLSIIHPVEFLKPTTCVESE